MLKFYSNFKPVVFVAVLAILGTSASAQLSVAREWNEVLLEAIRDDNARPTVHARNLFHTSVVMYDAWAVYDDEARPYFLSGMLGDYEVDFQGIVMPEDVEAEREAAISYAAYTLLSHRFANSPGAAPSQFRFNLLMGELGYDIEYTSTDYVSEGGAALGNYLAQQMIEFGLQDGANEINNYANQVYSPVNVDCVLQNPGNPNLLFPNRWQPLWIPSFVDQSNEAGSADEFLSPEWGEVVPFAMDAEEDMELFFRDGHEWKVWMDAGDPPYHDPADPGDFDDNWKWGHAMVAVWSGQLNQDDGVMIDISPATIGNNLPFPESFDDFDQFYNFLVGGDASQGWDMNPHTGLPYEPQMVPRGDYGRILAEFWADGPDSETPPGHWFTLVNYVHDHPEANLSWMGEGDPLDDLEWDIKTYFTLGGAMHDAAVAAWSNKGYYDYSRPVSALRYMAMHGQSTDDTADNYSPLGIPLVPGYIETIESGDPLAGVDDENVGRIKFYAWRGPEYLAENPLEPYAGVDWILGEHWWPYQRQTFVTPPFAGYISGHSTFSRAAAEVLTLITGDAFWPGGMGTFEANQNDFLVFEEGPSVDCVLQWATYRDASDQCSLSRIWGGIHPPADDVPGRKIGEILGPQAVEYANSCIMANPPRVESAVAEFMTIADAQTGGTFSLTLTYNEMMDETSMPEIAWPMSDPSAATLSNMSVSWSDAMTAVVMWDVADANETLSSIYVSVSGALDLDGNTQDVYLEADVFSIDTENPMTVENMVSEMMITDANADGGLSVTVTFNEAMDMGADPVVSFPNEDPSATLVSTGGSWSDDMNYTATFDSSDADEDVCDVDIQVTGATDAAGNMQMAYDAADQFCIDTENPSVFVVTASNTVLTPTDDAVTFLIIFDEDMDESAIPAISFPNEDPTAQLSNPSGDWVNSTTYSITYDVNIVDTEDVIILNIDVEVSGGADSNGNPMESQTMEDVFSIDFTFVGVDEHDLDLISAYPNPVTSGEDFVVSLNNVPESFNLQIYNMNGQVVFNEQMNKASNSQVRVSSAGFAAGLYIVHIHSDAGQAVFKLDVVK